MGIQCDCSADVEHEGNSGYCERIVRSRKDTTCCECGEAIPRGEPHELAGGFHEDKSRWTARTCLPCMRIRQHYCPHGWYFGQLAEQIEPCIGFDYRELPRDEPDDPRYDGDVALARTERLAGEAVA